MFCVLLLGYKICYEHTHVAWTHDTRNDFWFIAAGFNCAMSRGSPLCYIQYSDRVKKSLYVDFCTKKLRLLWTRLICTILHISFITPGTSIDYNSWNHPRDHSGRRQKYVLLVLILILFLIPVYPTVISRQTFSESSSNIFTKKIV